MKIIIEAPFSEEDLVDFAKFMRDKWSHRPDNCFILIKDGLRDKTAEEVMQLFKKIFEGSPHYKEIIAKPGDAKHLFSLDGDEDAP